MLFIMYSAVCVIVFYCIILYELPIVPLYVDVFIYLLLVLCFDKTDLCTHSFIDSRQCVTVCVYIFMFVYLFIY
jgi:hypothetical protein